MFKGVKKFLNKIKLFVIFFYRILFVRNHFKCSFIKKLRANFGGGFLADQWMLYDFDHNDKKQYLSEFDWYRSRYINAPFDYILNNKILASELLKQYVRVPEDYVIKNDGFLSSFEGEGYSYEYVVDLIAEKGDVFIKPFGVGKGVGVCNIRYQDGAYTIDGKAYDREELIAYLKGRDDWFIAESMHQHEYLNNIYDKTTNTLRMIALRDPKTHQFKLFFAVQRIGTSATIPVDNGSRGGLVAKVDLDTGVLTEARCLHNRNVYKVHPDSGKPIEGVQIPNWESVKQQVLDLTNHMPYMHFIAWDVLILESGEVCIIEGNTSSGVNIIQLWGGQRYGELGEFYRYHGCIK